MTSDFQLWEERYRSPKRHRRLEAGGWLRENLALLPPGRALDVAMGEGRNALFLARLGYRVTGIDRSPTAVATAAARAAEEGLEVRFRVWDLEARGLPAGPFEVIVVMRYLQRGLFPALQDSLAVGGVLVYESFTRDYLKYGPRNPRHLLEPGELRRAFPALELLRYRESDDAERGEARASLVARASPPTRGLRLSPARSGEG